VRRIVKERANGEEHFAVWSSVVMDYVTAFMPREAMARYLKANYANCDPDALMRTAVHPDNVYD
jgi:hypothetical protein